MADMDLEGIVAKVEHLPDLELATLLCLISKQHCLIETEEGLIDDVSQELALIASDIFNLSYVVLSLDDYESSEAFGNAILDQRSSRLYSQDEYVKPWDDVRSDPPYRFNSVATQAESLARPVNANLDTRKLVNVVIAKDFNCAPEGIQIQGLELIRRKRIFSRTTIHTAPEVFLFLPLISRSDGTARLNKHLIDRIFISHYHHPEDGFPNLEEIDVAAHSDDQYSSSSVVRTTYPRHRAAYGGSKRFEIEVGLPIPADGINLILKQEIDKVRHLSQSTTISAEVRRYLQDIVVFLRLERGVAGGVSPYATSQFELLTKCLATLHGLEYITPSLVALAARKIYAHRLLLCTPEKERSMQYGSDLEAVQEAMEGLTPDDVIEAVLNSVETPL